MDAKRRRDQWRDGQRRHRDRERDGKFVCALEVDASVLDMLERLQLVRGKMDDRGAVRDALAQLLHLSLDALVQARARR